MTRNYFDTQYKKWRAAVRKRDGRMCKWPNCGAKRGLQCHHILPWAGAPFLRYSVSNGITLCKKHHKLVTGKELIYAMFLRGLICKL